MSSTEPDTKDAAAPAPAAAKPTSDSDSAESSTPFDAAVIAALMELPTSPPTSPAAKKSKGLLSPRRTPGARSHDSPFSTMAARVHKANPSGPRSPFFDTAFSPLGALQAASSLDEPSKDRAAAAAAAGKLDASPLHSAPSVSTQTPDERQHVHVDAHRLRDGGLLVRLDDASHVVYAQEEPAGTRLIIDGRRCLLANEKDPQLQYNLANVLRDDKDYSEAEIHYLEAIKLKPDFAAAHNGLGATYYCLSDFDKAEQHINKAISLKKDYALAYYHLGLTLAAKGDAQRAIDAYEASLKFEKNSAYKKDTLAKIAELKGAAAKPNESAASVQKVGGSLDSVTSFMETGKFGKAEALLAAMVATKHSRDASFWNTLGYCQLKQGLPAKVAQSVTNFKKAVELSDGRLIEANYNLANAYKKMGKWMSARKACNAAIDEARRQEKLCPLVHNLHGIILKHSGDLKGAESAYRIAIAQSMGKLPVAHYNRGLVLEKMKKTRDAVKEYKNYLRDAPSGANAARARNHIAALMGS